ncbi:MAG TPA: IS4 family transposase [Planctomycetota bacterium]|nr:IS4 family transposase [Planctomycetota bacterium]
MARRRRSSRARRMRQELAENPGTIFDRILRGEEVDEECRWLGHVWRERVFTPLVTLWTFLWQVLSVDGSCRDAVARVLTFLRVTRGLDASHDPSSYCTARQRLPRELLPRLTRRVADRLAAQAEPDPRWHGRRVTLVDGSSVQMPDTRALQEVYPQPSAQKPGCGFPVARLVGLFDLVTGAIRTLAMDALSAAETTLFRRLWGECEPGEILVGDGLFSGYADIALLRERGVDVVFGKHVRRKISFREGQRLGRHDRLQTWTKGPRPKWMSRSDYAALPATQAVRVLRIQCTVPGWRPETITVVTTLLDPTLYTARDIADLYRRRWDVETDLSHLKTTMGMELLRTRSPEMIEREVWAHLLAYNLVRTLMWDAARTRRLTPLALSFKGALQEMMALWPYTAAAARESDMRDFYDALLRAIATHKIPRRPGRTEPRLRKRRPKNYSLLGAPRRECRRQS